MLRLGELLIIGFAFADSGDTSSEDSDSGSGDSGPLIDCGSAQVNAKLASYQNGVCYTADTSRMCEGITSPGCPNWNDAKQWGEDFRFFKCGPGTITYDAVYVGEPEGAGGAAYYFDSRGTLMGKEAWDAFPVFCCDGRTSDTYAMGTVGCPNPVEIFFEDSGVEPEPAGACGCTGRTSSTAAVFGLLLLVRRWRKP